MELANPGAKKTGFRVLYAIFVGAFIANHLIRRNACFSRYLILACGIESLHETESALGLHV